MAEGSESAGGAEAVTRMSVFPAGRPPFSSPS